jgi:hypothetical protein
MKLLVTLVILLISIQRCYSQDYAFALQQKKVDCVPKKLDLSNVSITNERHEGDPAQLFDEQALFTDPSIKTSSVPKTIWFPGWKATGYPASVSINLRNPAYITSIYLMDSNNTGYFKIESGYPGSWNPIAEDSLKKYQQWIHHPVNVISQYLRFTRQNAGANVSEVVLYGCMLPDQDAPAPIADLRIQQVTDESVKLIWKATGDDGNFGSAVSYDIRYSNKLIDTELEFKNANSANNDIVPLFAGHVQSFLVRNLEPETRYYFSIRAKDEMGKESKISNCVYATTFKEIKKQRITMDKFIGANAFVDDPLDKLLAVGFIREYHDWRWDEGGPHEYEGYPNNKIMWAPSAAGDPWNFDEFYQQLKLNSIEISPVIQGSVRWLQKKKDFPANHKPLDNSNANPTDPNSYQAKAHHMFQFAARYGQQKVSTNKLTLQANQPKNTGLDVIKYMEDWNEPNAYWLGPDGEFTPAEYAAMASANYDGHGNTMKEGTKTFGIKNADSTMKFVMGGIAATEIQWIKDIEYWFENNRADNKFIPDVINVHHYSWRDGKGWQGGGPAKGPEEDNFKERMQTLVDYRNNHFPNTEVWVSEFGWDTHPGSPISPPLIAPFSREEVQAQWLVRAYLAFAAAGIDRAQMYMLRDVNGASSRWYSSSGLTTKKGEWKPKPSWYYVYTLKNTLTNMVFLGEVESSDPNVLIYKFKDIDKPNGAYVLWSKTKENYRVDGYPLPLGSNPGNVTKIQMSSESIHGLKTELKVTSNYIAVDVSETPVFILVDKI